MRSTVVQLKNCCQIRQLSGVCGVCWHYNMTTGVSILPAALMVVVAMGPDGGVQVCSTVLATLPAGVLVAAVGGLLSAFAASAFFRARRVGHVGSNGE